jgi:ATP-dependent helicase HrpB
MVVEPRRVACRALAMHVADLAGGRLGDDVGYRVRFESKASDETRLLFVTPGVALNMIASGESDRFTHVMIDEFHERGWEVDLVVASLRRRSTAGQSLLLCSATLDVDRLRDRLDATVVRAEGRSFPVEIEYSGTGAPSSEDLEDRVAAAVQRLIERGVGGDVLVFLPGRGEIRRTASTLAGRVDAPIVELHGGISPRAMVDAFAPGERSEVVLATNVAESAVTIPGVTAVVDSGLARTVQHRAGRSLLALGSIAGDAMAQRAGRAGRLAPGRCLRLWGREYRYEPHTPPSIERERLDALVLRAASCGLGGSAFDDAQWPTAPPPFAVEQARARLRDIGALDEHAELTARGRALSRIPVRPSSAAALFDAPPTLAATLADLFAVVESGRPILDHRAVGSGQESPWRDAPDEVTALVRALRGARPGRDPVHARALEEARRVADSLRRLVGVEATVRGDGSRVPPAAELAAHLLSRVPHFAFVRRQRRAKGRRRDHRGAPWANAAGDEVMIDEWELEDERRDPPVAGVVLSVRWLGTGRSARGVGGLLVPCSPAALARAGLGEVDIGEVRVDRRGGAVRVFAALIRTLGGRELERSERRLRGPELRGAAARLIQEGRLMRPALDRVEEALHVEDLLGQAEGLGPSPQGKTDLRDWIARRLETLGVEVDQDLGLLEPEDLVPSIDSHRAAMAGLDRLRADFPLVITDRDARYRVHVLLERKRVVLEPANALAKKRGEPDARHVPRLRGFRVEFRYGSRVVRVR